MKHLIYKIIGTPNFVRIIEWREILKWLRPKEGEKIFVACGNGILSLKIAERGCQVYGIDVARNAIRHARCFAEKEKITCEFIVGDAEDLPFSNAYFDKIVCSSSLEHFKNDVRALSEMYRVLNPNGLVILTTDSFTYPLSNQLKILHTHISHVVNYYTYKSIKKKFEVAGFNIVRTKYLLNSSITSFFHKLD